MTWSSVGTRSCATIRWSGTCASCWRFGPELRQYIVSNNDEERPFSRDQRRWVYASSKLENNYFGFGTDNDVENAPAWAVIKHRTFAGPGAPTASHAHEEASLPSAKVLGGPRGRRAAFRPGSVVNVSGMSFGALSGNAIEALNRGAAMVGCLHNTGEGAISSYHLHGADLVFQIGTGYFGCRDHDGNFDLGRLQDLVASTPVRAIEIKLSQGAKPGLGGMLPGAKVSAEIASIRGIQQGVDFVSIDGGEGGTGAAPLIFADAVAYPFRLGFAEVYKRFAAAGLTDEVTFIGAGKLGIPENAIVAFALGADMVNIGREAMLSIGCIQAQQCHTDHCHVGVATQNPRYTRGLDPTLKSVRFANYVKTMRRDLLKVAEAVGVVHPGLIGPEDVDVVDRVRSSQSVLDVYGYQPGWSHLGAALQQEIAALMAPQVQDTQPMPT